MNNPWNTSLHASVGRHGDRSEPIHRAQARALRAFSRCYILLVVVVNNILSVTVRRRARFVKWNDHWGVSRLLIVSWPPVFCVFLRLSLVGAYDFVVHFASICWCRWRPVVWAAWSTAMPCASAARTGYVCIHANTLLSFAWRHSCHANGEFNVKSTPQQTITPDSNEQPLQTNSAVLPLPPWRYLNLFWTYGVLI